MHSFSHILTTVALLFSLLTFATAGLVPKAKTQPKILNNQYIVTLKQGSTTNDVQRILNLLGVNNVLQTLHIAGLNVLVTNSVLVSLKSVLQTLGIVDSIEPDYILQPFAMGVQTNAPHGLDQISHRTPSSYNYNYIYDDSLGQNTCAYIVDTGIQRDHAELAGRSFTPVYCVGSGGCKNNANANGSPYGDHGTQVAGALLGNSAGVARKAKYMDLQVFSSDPSSGATSVILSALQYASAHYSAVSSADCKNGATINLSFGYQPTGSDQPTALTSAINKVVQQGMFVVAAAGNDNTDANTYVPARTPAACTVGSVTGVNAKADFSNYGSVVDVWAPGTGVYSSVTGGGYAYADGTSLSSPLIAGLGMYLQSYCGAATGRKKNPIDLCSYIQKSGTAFALNTAGVATGYVGFNGGNGALCSGW